MSKKVDEAYKIFCKRKAIGKEKKITKEKFIEAVLNNDKFNKIFCNGCTRELTRDERILLAFRLPGFKELWNSESAKLNYPEEHDKLLDEYKIPKRVLI